MKKILEKVKFAVMVAADMVLLLLSPCGLQRAKATMLATPKRQRRRVSDPFKHPKY